jgi:hypothetical protein
MVKLDLVWWWVTWWGLARPEKSLTNGVELNLLCLPFLSN